jgi:hypothetical protein
MRGEAKPKQPIIGISLEPWELAEMKAICGGRRRSGPSGEDRAQPSPEPCRVCARDLGIVCERHLD